MNHVEAALQLKQITFPDCLEEIWVCEVTPGELGLSLDKALFFDPGQLTYSRSVPQFPISHPLPAYH